MICASIDGRIDAYTVERVEVELNSLIRIGSFNLVCDLEGVDFVSSAGFKAFRRIAHQAREQGGDLKFCGLNPEVSKIFSSVGFTREACVFSIREEARLDFEGGNVGKSVLKDSGEDGKAGFCLGSGVARLLNSVGLSRGGDDAGDKEEKCDEPGDEDDNGAAFQPTQIFARDTSLNKTVIFTKTNPKTEPNLSPATEVTKTVDSVPEHPAQIETVKMELYPEPCHFEKVTQMIGTIGSLVGFSSADLADLDVAVLEFCRILVEELESDESFFIEIDSNRPGFRVRFEIPRDEYVIYGSVCPDDSGSVKTEEEGKNWLLNFVDEVEWTSPGSRTRYLLSLED